MAIPLSEQLRQAIRDCGESRYALSKRTGIDQSTLTRFMSGERGLRLDVVDVLAEALGLELRSKGSRKGK
jgi:transcriptional regulator with XRE-family HTH domain